MDWIIDMGGRPDTVVARVGTEPKMVAHRGIHPGPGELCDHDGR